MGSVIYSKQVPITVILMFAKIRDKANKKDPIIVCLTSLFDCNENAWMQPKWSVAVCRHNGIRSKVVNVGGGDEKTKKRKYMDFGRARLDIGL